MGNGILHYRVDDRMVHGLVATRWLPGYQATRAMVIDGPASTNEITRAGLKMACPGQTALSVLAPEKAAANILSGKYANQRVFVVFRTIASAYEVFRAGVPMRQLNLGDVTQNKGEVTVLDKTVRVSPEERAMLKEMRDAGVKITSALAPEDTMKDVGPLLDEGRDGRKG